MPSTPCYPAPVNTPNGVVTIDGKRYQVDLDNRLWRDWFDVLFALVETLEGTSIQDLSDVALTAAEKADLTDGGETTLHTHQHNNTTARDGGSATEAFHLTLLQHTDLTDGGDSTIHFHQSDRDYADAGKETRVPKTGFPVDSAGNFLVTLSYNETTRTVTITPTGATFDVFVDGVKYTKTGAQSIVHSATQGNHFIYYDNTGTLVHATTVWDLHVTAPVMFVAWDATNSRGIPMVETHHAGTDPFIHQRLHEIDGTQYVSGFAISGYVLTTAGDANTTYAVASGVMADEDLHTTVDALADAGPYAILERVGADGHWELTRTSVIPFLRSGTDLQYNQNNAGTWQRTNVGNNNFTNYYVFGVPALPSASISPAPGTTEGIVIVPDQVNYATQAQANAATVSFLSWGVMPFQEIVPLYRILMGQFAAAGGTQQIMQVDRISGNRASFTLAASTDHGSLSGLTDPDHPASAIVNTPAGNIAATDVQAALNELDTEKQAVSAKDAANGYAGLSAESRITKGAITTDDMIVDNAAKGFVVKDTVTGNYFRISTASGVLVTTDLGASPP